MVDTIGPVVREERQGRRVEIAHLAGGLAGGALTGFFLGAIGALFNLGPHTPRWFVSALVVMAAAALVYDSSQEGRRVGLARQTPRSWRHVLPAGVAAFFNGLDLGLGWSTRIYFTSYLVAMAAALGTGHAFVGAAIGACFGGGRAAFVVVARLRIHGVLSIDRLAEQRPKIALLNGVALVQFGVVMSLAAFAVT